MAGSAAGEIRLMPRVVRRSSVSLAAQLRTAVAAYGTEAVAHGTEAAVPGTSGGRFLGEKWWPVSVGEKRRQLNGRALATQFLRGEAELCGELPDDFREGESASIVFELDREFGISGFGKGITIRHRGSGWRFRTLVWRTCPAARAEVPQRPWDVRG